jgi:hypothetical protein
LRYGNTILVMRRAPTIGRPTSAPRVSVYHRALNLPWALEIARLAIAHDTRRQQRAAYWIIRAGQPAHRKARTS